MKLKLVAGIVILTAIGSGTSYAGGFRIISEKAEQAAATADSARKATIDNIVDQLHTRVAGAVEDGNFETGLIFTDDLSQDIKEVIQSTFIKAGFKVLWVLDEKTKELRLLVSWR